MTTIIQRSNRSFITKKIIDLMIDFLRENFQLNRLYNNIKITDRFSMTAAQLPCIIVRQTTNSAKRTHFDDFMFDVVGRAKLTPVSADNDLVGNNIQRTNLPLTVDWTPLRPFDDSIGIPNGYDISEVVFTSGTAPYPSGNDSTGIIITIPPPTTFTPSSILYIKETPINQFYYPGTQSINYSGTFNAAIGRTADQFYFIYSGSNFSGVNVLPVSPDEYLVNPSGMSGVTIQLNDVLFAGDQYQIETYAEDEFIAERYGGRYDITINFDLYADSTLELQELADFTEQFLVQKKFDLWDKAGFNTTEWSKGSESEKAYLNEFIFQASITTAGFTEWFEDKSADLVSSIVAYSIPIGGYDASGNSVQMLFFVPSGTSGLSALPADAFDGGIWGLPPSGLPIMTSGAYYAPIGVSGQYVEISGSTYTSIFNQFSPYDYPFILPPQTTGWWLTQQ